jgi:Protein of unknown function DUF262/Protein of unknown function (DUF1524)
MAKTNLLNTSTTNFLELIGNGRTYRVPAYQRDYSWTEEQWEDIWNDILALTDRREDVHYMGALVVEGRSDREFAIIDGQQRIATLSVLVLAVIDRLQALAERGIDSDANRQRASALRGRFIGEKDPASLVEASKLSLNATDDAFYQDVLVQLRAPLNPRGLPKSNRLLWQCFEYFRKRLAELSDAEDGQRLAALLSESVGRQLMFIRITVDDELNAYTVFETLNARGLELSATDLLKNYLFSLLRVPNDLAVLQRRWQALIATVAQERFPEFLRYHLQCELPRVRSQRLFKVVRDRVRRAEDVFSLIDNLERRAELFAALFDPAHGYWIDRPGCRPFIRDLNFFRVRQMTPMVFAGWERLDADDFERLLKLATVFLFRYSVVGDLNPNALEPLFHVAAKGLLDGSLVGPAGVFSVLRPEYVSDQRFEQDFSRLAIDPSGQSRKVVRYILARLESDASGRHCDPETDPATVEHVLPANPVSDWEASIARPNWDAVVYRLGNLTFLEAGLNRRVGNAPYAEKREAYRSSRYALSQAIATRAPQEWTLAHIEDRQAAMAGRAITLWRSDFA